jgi:hypothetical protein
MRLGDCDSDTRVTVRTSRGSGSPVTRAASAASEDLFSGVRGAIGKGGRSLSRRQRMLLDWP